MEVNNLSFCYGKNKVLDRVSIKIERGRVTAILGPNGCGKTTFFNLMTRNLRPLEGEILLGGKNIQGIPLRAFAKQVAIVHH